MEQGTSKLDSRRVEIGSLEQRWALSLSRSTSGPPRHFEVTAAVDSLESGTPFSFRSGWNDSLLKILDFHTSLQI
ncbi:hypothetical protein TNCV_173891 [Trichonephila clavipes]|nr:hypothetical protein TNCV_173891 [Trichonephila clavipes]